MKFIYTIGLAVCISTVSSAQVRYFDLYNYNAKIINPAFAGVNNEQNFEVQYQSQDIKSNYNSSGLVSYSNRITKINSGVGFIFSNDKIGSYSNINAGFLYNYQFKIRGTGKLSLGTQLTYQKLSIVYSKLDLQNPGAQKRYEFSSGFNFDLGVLYRINNLTVSAGAKNLLQQPTKVPLFERFNARQYTFYALNYFVITSWLELSPSLLVSTNFKDTWLTGISGMVELKKLILLGATLTATESGTTHIYSAGLSVKDKVQIIGLLSYGSNKKYGKPIYPGIYTPPDAHGFELLLKFNIPN